MLRFFDFLRPPRLLPAALFAVCMLSAPAVYCQPALYCDQAVRLLSIDNTGFDNFGSSVDVDGDFAVVGARAHATAAGMTGAAHIFVRSGGSWVEDAKLTPSDGVAGDLFGQSVAISGDTAVVGAFWHATNGFLAGAAYVYVRDPVGGGWTEEQKLLPPTVGPGDQFGWDVAIDGDTIAVAANADGTGSVHIFDRSVMVWTEQVVLTPMDGAVLDGFGSGVAFEGETLIVGSPDHAHAGVAEGGAYVFVRSPGGVWAEEAELIASDTALDDGFGWGVAVSGDLIVVGASYHDAGGMNAGAAYLFRGAGATWTEEAKLQASTPRPSDFFGRGVDVEGGRVVVGAPTNDLSDPFGFVYYFVGSGGVWSEEDSFQAAGGTFMDWFGGSVALDRGTVVVGAHLRDDLGPNSGAAFVFECLDDPDEDPFPSDAFVNVTTTPAEDDTFKDGIESEASLLLPQALHAGQSSIRHSNRQREQPRHPRDRYRPGKGAPEAHLNIQNLTRDLHVLNWIRLDARKSRDRDGIITHYEYGVRAKSTGESIHTPGSSTSPVAYVLLSPGEYTTSVTITDDAGVSQTKRRRLSIPGTAIDGFKPSKVEWALGEQWRVGDPSMTISYTGGPLNFQATSEIFSDQGEALSVGLGASSGGCGSTFSTAGDSISIATGAISIVPGSALVLGPLNSAGAAMKMVGRKENSACVQGQIAAINEQLVYQEEQIQQIYVLIGRDENAFFYSLRQLTEELGVLETQNYEESLDLIREDFANFMFNAGLWSSANPSMPEVMEGVDVEALANCTTSEIRCCKDPLDANDFSFFPDAVTGQVETPQEYCDSLIEDGGPTEDLRTQALSNSSGLYLFDLTGSYYQTQGATDACLWDCYTRIGAGDNGTSPSRLISLYDYYKNTLLSNLLLCTSQDPSDRSRCLGAPTAGGTITNNIVDIYDAYNTAVVAIYQQSLYAVQQAYQMEWFVNQFNYNAPEQDAEIKQLFLSSTATAVRQAVPGTHYKKEMPTAEICGNKKADYLAEPGVTNQDKEGLAYNCAQEQLTLAYATRVNLLYTRALNYIVSDSPRSPMQEYPPVEHVISIDARGGGTVDYTVRIDYEAEVGSAFPAERRTPTDEIVQVTGAHTSSPNGPLWTSDSILYQFQIQNVFDCAETLREFNKDAANTPFDIADAFGDPRGCPALFSLDDGSPLTGAYYDGYTLQPYSYSVSPGGSASCPDACKAPQCESHPAPSSPSFCANENEYCACEGTVYYGKAYQNSLDPTSVMPGSGTSATFDEMIGDVSYASREVRPLSGVSCSTNVLGDPAVGYDKQCFCAAGQAPWAGPGDLGLMGGEASADWKNSDNGSWSASCYTTTAEISGFVGNQENPPKLCATCNGNPGTQPQFSCAVCTNARWGNDNGTLFCEDSGECRGFCSGDGLCGDYRYAVTGTGGQTYNDCTTCGGNSVLALSGRMAGNIKLCANKTDTSGNQMTWFKLPDSYAGNKAGLVPKVNYLTCGNWARPQTVSASLKTGASAYAYNNPLTEDTGLLAQASDDRRAVASVWSEPTTNNNGIYYCDGDYTLMSGSACKWDPNLRSDFTTSGVTAYNGCGSISSGRVAWSDNDEYFDANFFLEEPNPATNKISGGFPIPLALIYQCGTCQQSQSVNKHRAKVNCHSLVSSSPLFVYDSSTGTTTPGDITDTGVLCEPTYTDDFRETAQTLTCSVVDGREYVVGLTSEQFTSKQTNTGCPDQCYSCNAGAGGQTPGGKALVTGLDGRDVCDGFCSGYEFCGGEQYNQPNGDSGATDCTQCGASTLCAASEGDWCACGGDVYYGKKFVNSLSGSNSVPGSGTITSLEQMQGESTYALASGSAGLVQCSNDVFGDPAGGYSKHCHCAPSTATLCGASEDDYCFCDGDVYYGKKFVESLTSKSSSSPGSGLLTTFSQMTSDLTHTVTPGITGGIKCAYTVLGGDPAESYYKQCYCDAD